MATNGTLQQPERLTHVVRLADLGYYKETTGPVNINHINRGRYISIGADNAETGPGLKSVIADIETFFKKEVPEKSGITYKFSGQTEDFQELMVNMLVAIGLGILFIFLVLSSLYESFVTPFTIMLVLPLAYRLLRPVLVLVLVLH